MHRTRKILILRLSSMGDVILSTSALEALKAQDSSVQIHWVIRKEFADLLKTDTRIQKLWIHDRKLGFGGWMNLIRELWREEFTDVIDLHRSLRSRILLISFFLFGLFGKKRVRVQRLSKERWKNWGYYSLKSLWPRALRPRPYWKRASEAALRSSGQNKSKADQFHPALKNFAQKISNPSLLKDFENFLAQSNGKSFICAMGGAQWTGKRLSREVWLDFLAQNKDPVVILGQNSDEDSVWLAGQLQDRQHFSAVGKLSLSEVAWVVSQSRRVFSNDTGIVHLAEAVGIPATVFFGPTRADMGFGPWMQNSKSIESKLWCSPCSKDGSACFRIGNDRFACQKKFQGAVFS